MRDLPRLFERLIEQPLIETRLQVPHCRHWTTGLPGKVNTTIQEKPFNQLADMKGKVGGADFY